MYLKLPETALSTSTIVCTSEIREVNFFKTLLTLYLETKGKDIQINQRTKQDWRQMFQPGLEDWTAMPRSRWLWSERQANKPGEAFHHLTVTEFSGRRESVEKQFYAPEIHHTPQALEHLCPSPDLERVSLCVVRASTNSESPRRVGVDTQTRYTLGTTCLCSLMKTPVKACFIYHRSTLLGPDRPFIIWSSSLWFYYFVVPNANKIKELNCTRHELEKKREKSGQAITNL